MSAPGDVAVLAPGTLRGRTVMVTGAGSGIGRAIALRCTELGADVVGVGRTEEKLAETGALAADRPGEFSYRICDVRDLEAATAVVEEAGLTDLVNNAGGQFFARAVDISPRGWQAVINLNLNAVFSLMVAAHPALARARGSVVNITLSGVERGSMGLAHSVAARAGVLGLSRTVALEWAAEGVRVNCLGPGTVLNDALDAESREQVERGMVARGTPMGRVTEAEEVAELTAYLLSPAAAMMTGQLLQVDGGAHIGAGLHVLPEAYE